MLTQSIDLHAGTTPLQEIRPLLGLNPTMPLSAAGTLPEPAVSVPNANAARPVATAIAEPEEDPPLISSGRSGWVVIPKGDLVPTNPVANWSMFVLPIGIAPALINISTTKALSGGR